MSKPASAFLIRRRLLQAGAILILATAITAATSLVKIQGSSSGFYGSNNDRAILGLATTKAFWEKEPEYNESFVHSGLCIGYGLGFESTQYGWPFYFADKSFGIECADDPAVWLYPVAFTADVAFYAVMLSAAYFIYKSVYAKSAK